MHFSTSYLPGRFAGERISLARKAAETPLLRLSASRGSRACREESGFHRMATLIEAEPEAIGVNPERTAVIVIDMQRDFLSRAASVNRWATTFRS